MTEVITKRVTAERAKHSLLPTLLTRKRLYTNGDYGWELLVKRWNQLKPTAPRTVEVTFFRPSEEEFVRIIRETPAAYANRKLRPASVFEVLAVLPDDREGREALCKELGSNFLVYIHGHYVTSWLGRGFPCLEGKYGWKLDFGSNIIGSRKYSWYVGFRKLDIQENGPPA